MSNKPNNIEQLIEDELSKVTMLDVTNVAESVNNGSRDLQEWVKNEREGGYVQRSQSKGSQVAVRENKSLLRVICSNSSCGKHVAVNPNKASLRNIGSKCSDCGSLLLLEK